MSGVGYAYDWIRRRRRREEKEKKRGKELEKKVKKAVRYRHSRRKIARTQKQHRKKK